VVIYIVVFKTVLNYTIIKKIAVTNSVSTYAVLASKSALIFYTSNTS